MSCSLDLCVRTNNQKHSNTVNIYRYNLHQSSLANQNSCLSFVFLTN